MMLIDIGLALADSERLIDPRLGRDGALCRIGYGLPHELNGIDRKIVWFHDHRGAVVLTQAGDKSGLARLALIRRKQIQFGNEYAIRKCDLPHGYGMVRSEEHTSELQSLMRISYAVFCLKKKITEYRNTKQHSKHKQ